MIIRQHGRWWRSAGAAAAPVAHTRRWLGCLEFHTLYLRTLIGLLLGKYSIVLNIRITISPVWAIYGIYWSFEDDYH